MATKKETLLIPALYRMSFSVKLLGRLIITFFLLILLPKVTFTQSLSSSDVIENRLKSGFRYYLVEDKNADNIKFTFVNNVGFFWEERTEHGISHLVEHLGMRSTLNFPSGLRGFFLDRGLNPGRDIEASTNMSTVYSITIPASDTTLRAKAFLAVYDWAKGIVFKDGQLAEERAAVINENARAQDSLFESNARAKYIILNRNSLYARLVDSLDYRNVSGASVESLTKFYKKWYTPERQALIVTGNFNRSEIEDRVTSVFRDLAPNGIPLPTLNDVYKKYEVALDGKNHFTSISHGSRDKSTVITIYNKRKAVRYTNNSDQYKSTLLKQMYNELLLMRFANNDSIGPDKKVFAEIQSHAVHDLAGIEALEIIILMNNSELVERSVKWVLTELFRIKKWGFETWEFEVARNIVEEKLRKGSSQNSLTTRLINSFAFNSPLLDGQSCLNSLELCTLGDVNNMTNFWIDFDRNVDFLMSFANETTAKKYQKKDPFAWVRDVFDSAIQAAPAPRRIEFAEPKIKGHKFVVHQATTDGITRVSLANGIQIYIKSLGPTSKARGVWNEVAVRGFATRRKLTADNLDASVVKACTQTVGMSGVASLSGFDLMKWENQQNNNRYLSLKPYIITQEIGFRGASSLDKLPDLLKLLYYYRYQPRLDSAAFETWRKVTNAKIQRDKTAAEIFEDSIQYAFGTPSIEDEGAITFREVQNVFDQFYSNTEQLQFVVTGFFQVRDIIPLLNRYLGSLPKAKFQDHLSPQKNFSSARGKSQVSELHSIPTRRVNIGRDSAGSIDVRMLLLAQCTVNEYDNIYMEVVNEMISQVLFTRLRETEKGTYSVASGLKNIKDNGQFYLDISFEAQPNSVDRLIKATLDEITMLSGNNFTTQVFNNAVAAVRKRHENQTLFANPVAEMLLNQLRLRKKNLNLNLEANQLDGLTSDQVQNILRTAFVDPKYCVFTLF